jgi:hypothetical protein
MGCLSAAAADVVQQITPSAHHVMLIMPAAETLRAALSVTIDHTVAVAVRQVWV